VQLKLVDSNVKGLEIDPTELTFKPTIAENYFEVIVHTNYDLSGQTTHQI
jgi:hypothetical protein